MGHGAWDMGHEAWVRQKLSRKSEHTLFAVTLSSKIVPFKR